MRHSNNTKIFKKKEHAFRGLTSSQCPRKTRIWSLEEDQTQTNLQFAAVTVMSEWGILCHQLNMWSLIPTDDLFLFYHLRERLNPPRICLSSTIKWKQEGWWISTLSHIDHLSVSRARLGGCRRNYITVAELWISGFSASNQAECRLFWAAITKDIKLAVIRIICGQDFLLSCAQTAREKDPTINFKPNTTVYTPQKKQQPKKQKCSE